MFNKCRRSYSAQTILRKSKGPFPKEVLNAGEDLFTALYSKNIEEIKRKVKKNKNDAGRKPALKRLEVLEEEPENWPGENHDDTFDALLKDTRPRDCVNSCRNSSQDAENKENQSGLFTKFKDDKRCGMVKKTHGFTKCGWRSVNSHICSKKNKKNFKNSRKTKRLIPVNNTYIDLLESFNSLSDLTEQFLSGKVDIKGVKRNSSKFKMQELTGEEETSFQKNSDAEPDEEFLRDNSRRLSKSRLTVVNRNCAITSSSLNTINSRKSKKNSKPSINTPADDNDDDDEDDNDDDYFNSSQYLHVLTQQILSGKESNITLRRKESKHTPQRPTGREISCSQINYETESAEIPVNSTPLNLRTKISACHLSPIDPLFYTEEAQLHEDENEDVRCGDASHSTPVCSRTYIIHSNCKSEQKSTSTFRADSLFEEVDENFSPKNVKVVDNNTLVDSNDYVPVIISQEALARSPDPFASYIALPCIDNVSLNVSSKVNQCFSASNDNSMKERKSLEESLFKEEEITGKSVSADISSESERFLREGLSLLCLDYNDAKNDPVSQSVINCTKEITGKDVSADISSESEGFLRERRSLLSLDYCDAKNDPVSQSVINCTKEITGKDVSADISSESEGFLRERRSLLSLDYCDAKSDSVSQSVINCTKEITGKDVSADISSESEGFLRERRSLLSLDYCDAKSDSVSQSVINCTKEITGKDVSADISSESEGFLRERRSLLSLDYCDAKSDSVSQSVINCTKEITGKDVSADISSESEGFLRERRSLLSLDYCDAKSDSVSQSVINCTKEVNSLCSSSMLEKNLHPKRMNITRPTFGFRKTVNMSCRYSSRRSHIVIPVNKNFEGSLTHSRFQSAYCYPEEDYERHFECNESDESISDTRHYDNIFKNLVLEHCGQEHALSFETLFSDCDLENSKKIGEGVYGEVFTRIYNNGKATVMKILPIEGSCEINGERQKSFEEILPEIVITKELSNLRINECFRTENFPELVHCYCVQGSYPSNLLTLWNKYNEEKGSENDSPEILPIDQMYIILEMSNAGTDLESFVFTTAVQTVSVFKQIVCTLAAAEAALQFEHRDLHWGNILLKETTSKTITWKLFGKEYVVTTKGIQASVIDFTLSRITYGGCSIFNNLADDPAIFEGEGDYQFEIYRLMKNQVRDNWEQFEPYNNVLWLSYVLEKLIKEVHYKKRSLKTHKNSIIELRKFQKEIMNFQSAVDVAQFLFRKVR